MGPAALWAQGEREPPDLSLRNERSLTHERSLRLSSSEEDISPGGWEEGYEGWQGKKGNRNKVKTKTEACKRLYIICEMYNSSPTGLFRTTYYY